MAGSVAGSTAQFRQFPVLLEIAAWLLSSHVRIRDAGDRGAVLQHPVASNQGKIRGLDLRPREYLEEKRHRPRDLLW